MRLSKADSLYRVCLGANGAESEVRRPRKCQLYNTTCAAGVAERGTERGDGDHGLGYRRVHPNCLRERAGEEIVSFVVGVGGGWRWCPARLSQKLRTIVQNLDAAL